MLNQGKLLEALDFAKRGVELQPKNADAHLVLGTCLDQNDQRPLAIEHFKEATRLNPKHVKAFLNLGFSQMRLHAYSDAALSFSSALDLQPEARDVHHHLACALANNGQYSASLPHFQEALAATPGSVRIMRDFGRALEHLYKYSEARQVYEEALSIRPDTPVLHMRLGHICQVEGDFDGSETHLRKALELSGDHPEAYQMLSLIERLKEDDLPVIQNLLLAGGLSDHQREALSAAQGRFYDQLGEYTKAFESFQGANALRRAKVDYDPDAHDRYVDDLIGRYDADWFKGGSASHPGPCIVFLVGMPRSGSTLIHQILSSHKDVRGIGEAGHIERLVSRQHGAGSGEHTGDELWSREDLNALWSDYLDALDQDVRAAKVIVDKSLNNIFHLGPILRAFPNAHVIHCSRDPGDILVSCYFSSFRDTVAYSFDLDHLVRHQGAVDRLVRHWKAVLTERFRECSYERLIADLEPQTRALLQHIGLPWDPSCLEFATAGEQIATSSIFQVRQKIYVSSVGRWKNYAHLLPPRIARALGSTDASSQMIEPSASEAAERPQRPLH
ncbi:MAG: sulfotransferase [Pseudomonadota bacterium]